MDLKPCPFCGSEMWYIGELHGRPGVPLLTVVCSRCKARGPESDYIQRAKNVWNQRKTPNVQYAEVLAEWMKDPEFKGEYDSDSLEAWLNEQVRIIEERESGT